MNNHNNLDLGHVQTMAEIDRISNLPDELISEIVSRLSVKEAATTCVLSKRWRHVFALITRLEFDHSCRATLKQFDNALRACRSERITMVKLKIGLVDSKRFKFWMSFPLSRGVKQLEVVARLRNSNKLPLALFECQTLEVLKLDVNQTVELPSSFSLPNLKVLRLCLVSFRDKDFITRLVSRIPLLECLDLTGSRETFEPINDVISTPLLSSLVIRLLTIKTQKDKLILDAPNLKYLEYSLGSELQYLIGDLNSLVKAHLNVPLTSEVRLFRSLSNVESLYLGASCIQSLKKCGLKLPVFCNLHHLQIAFVHSQSHHDLVLQMLNASPVLETISFQKLNDYWNDGVLQEDDDWNKSETIPSCLESHLKRVVIVDYYPWAKLEQALVIYFLRYALVLEELVVITMNLGSFTLAERILLERDLQNLSKGSTNCSIKLQF